MITKLSKQGLAAIEETCVAITVKDYEILTAIKENRGKFLREKRRDYERDRNYYEYKFEFYIEFKHADGLSHKGYQTALLCDDSNRPDQFWSLRWLVGCVFSLNLAAKSSQCKYIIITFKEFIELRDTMRRGLKNFIEVELNK